MAYTYTTIDGQRVETNVADAYRKLEAAFKDRWGLDLLITSGIRTRAEQQALYDAWKAGTGNLAAAPGQSNHEGGGPRGPRALDIRDSGGDPGVTRIGTARNNWIRDNCGRFGFDHAGLRFNPPEGWHIEYTGALHQAGDGDTTSSSKAKPTDMLRWKWTGIQHMLKRYYGYHGRIDNIPGPGTVAAFQRFIKAKGYRNLRVDGQFGPNTCRGAQQWLKSRWGYTGPIDAIPGAGTKAAWSTAERENAKAFG